LGVSPVVIFLGAEVVGESKKLFLLPFGPREGRGFHVQKGKGGELVISPEEMIRHRVVGKSCFRRGIVPGGAVMAPLESIRYHQGTLDQPIFSEGSLGVLGAGGLEGADLTLLGGEGLLVEGDGCHRWPGKGRGGGRFRLGVGRRFQFQAVKDGCGGPGGYPHQGDGHKAEEGRDEAEMG